MRSLRIAAAALLAALVFAPQAAGAQLGAGDIVVADPNSFGGDGGLIDVNPDTGRQAAVSNDAISFQKLFTDPSGAAFNPQDGTLLVADPDSPAPISGGKGAIIAVDPATGLKKLVTNDDSSQAKTFSDPRGVAVETPGTLLVANTSSDPNTDGVILVNRSSAQQYALSFEGLFAAPTGIAMDLDGRALVADRDAFGGGGGVIRVDPTTGAKSTVA